MSNTISKIARHYQVTIPRSIRKISGLKEGELINFEVRDGEIVITPVCVVKKDQSYFFNEKWQKTINNSEEEIIKGNYKVYHNSKELEKGIDK
ncbi:AbrB/MazE/SpoVT family DNA-binding domain-containing protein [Candidatus Poribacteria bacterium]|nr:AbrB/MazE/SpoVT family DNA-binding domain-containing protein [Candidatus Poribacteria bacterium]